MSKKKGAYGAPIQTSPITPIPTFTVLGIYHNDGSPVISFDGPITPDDVGKMLTSKVNTDPTVHLGIARTLPPSRKKVEETERMELSGVSVQIDGHWAFISGVNSGRVNVIAAIQLGHLALMDSLGFGEISNEAGTFPSLSPL